MNTQKGFLPIPIIIGVAVVAMASFFGLLQQNKVADLELKIEQMDNQLDENLGATRFVSSDIYKLSGSGVSANAVSIILQSFTEPISGEELSMADFGSIGYATLEPGNKSKKEIISFTSVSQSGSDTKATLGGVVRGLMFTFPYTASTSLALSHSGGTRVIISNPPQLYNRLLAIDNDATITGEYVFDTATPTRYNATLTAAEASSDDRNIVDYYTVRTIATSGAANALYNITGIVQLATTSELTIGTATSSVGEYLVVPSELVHSSSSANQIIALTRDSGKFEQGFFDLTESWTFTGSTTFASTTINNTLGVTGTSSFASSTITGSLEVSGTSTFTGTTTFLAIPTLPAIDPTDGNQAVRKAYADQLAIIEFTAAENVTAGRAVMILNNGKVAMAVGDIATTTNLFIGFFEESKSSGETVKVKHSGIESNLTGLSTSTIYYLKNTAISSTETITQASQDTSFNGDGVTHVQTFKSTKTLVVSVKLWVAGGAGDTLIISIYDSSDVRLGVTNVTAITGGPQEITFTFISLVLVNPGETYKLKWNDGSDGDIFVYYQNSDVYADGQLDALTADLYFKVNERSGDGIIDTSPGSSERKVGISVSATELLILND